MIAYFDHIIGKRKRFNLTFWLTSITLLTYDHITVELKTTVLQKTDELMSLIKLNQRKQVGSHPDHKVRLF